MDGLDLRALARAMLTTGYWSAETHAVLVNTSGVSLLYGMWYAGSFAYPDGTMVDHPKFVAVILDPGFGLPANFTGMAVLDAWEVE